MLRLHKLRAFLTMLGVIIGVMSVTIIVMVSNGFTYFMTHEFEKLGSDTIIVAYDPGRGNRMGLGSIDGLKNEDVTYLMDHVSTLDIAAPIVQVPVTKAVRGDREVTQIRVFASNEHFSELNRLQLVEGRYLDESDMSQRSSVCLIGEELRDRLFDGKALGRYLTLGGMTLQVVGVLERIDIMGQTTARDVLLPITTAQSKWLGTRTVSMITTRPKPGVPVDQAMNAVWEAMMQRSGNRAIYRVESRESLLNAINKVFGVAGIVLAGIAALSLLVGGIGIMNIMLVSVTERTKEIGLRKAVGAKQASVLTQFLVESATLSLVGGLIGMGIAWCLGLVVTMGTASINWPSPGGLPTPFPIQAAIAATIFSALIGVVFGLFPAISAAKLDPIVALRRE
jgi:putative ABC transport system permease protein